MLIRPYQTKDEAGIIDLWNRCGLTRAWNDPKINLQIRKDNLQAIAFYESIGFSDDSVVSFGKRLVSDE